jgi:hypothetical protein
MKLSPHEVADLAIKAGFSATVKAAGLTDSEAVVFVAVCIGESGLDSDVMARSADKLPDGTPNPNAGNRDHGLGQISGRWNYDKIQAVGGNWRDPAVNIGVCYRIFTGAARQFTPWHVYTGGGYKAWLPDARLAVAHPWPYVDRAATSSTQLTALTAGVTALRADVAAVLASLRKHLT